MKKLITALLSVFFLIHSLKAQDNTTATAAKSAQSIYLEFLGNGIGFSANYDARFKKSQKGLGYRIGVGFFPATDIIIAKSSTIFTLPFGLNYLAGKGPSYFEGGLGATYLSGTVGSFFGGIFGDDEEKFSGFLFLPSAGYRYAPLNKGFTFRIFISPAFSSGGGGFFGGASVGYKIK